MSPEPTKPALPFSEQQKEIHSVVQSLIVTLKPRTSAQREAALQKLERLARRTNDLQMMQVARGYREVLANPAAHRRHWEYLLQDLAELRARRGPRASPR